MKPIGPKFLPYNGGVPRHWNCRSTEVPITMTYRELGVERDETRGLGQRASAGGLVPADMDYEAWLKGQPQVVQNRVLGKGIADMWRDGKITFADLISRVTQEPMRLKDFVAGRTVASMPEVLVRSTWDEVSQAMARVAGWDEIDRRRKGTSTMTEDQLTAARAELAAAWDRYYAALDAVPESEREALLVSMRSGLQAKFDALQAEFTDINAKVVYRQMRYAEAEPLIEALQAQKLRVMADKINLDRQILHSRLPESNSAFETPALLIRGLEKLVENTPEYQRLRDLADHFAQSQLAFENAADADWQRYLKAQAEGRTDAAAVSESFMNANLKRFERAMANAQDIERQIDALRGKAMDELMPGMSEEWKSFLGMAPTNDPDAAFTQQTFDDIDYAVERIREAFGSNPLLSGEYRPADGTRGLFGQAGEWDLSWIPRKVFQFGGHHDGQGAGRHYLALRENTGKGTMFHEFGHLVETVDDLTATYVQEFLRYRAGLGWGNPLTPREWAQEYPDERPLESYQQWYKTGLITRYAQVVYSYLPETAVHRATEFLSEGLEEFLLRPRNLFFADPEMFEAIFHIVTGRIPRPGYWDRR